MAHLIPPASSGFPVDVTAEATLGRPLGVVKFAATEVAAHIVHAIREFVTWYYAEPRLALNRTVVLRSWIHLEQQGYAPATINLRLAAVRRIAYEAADAGLLSPELAAGIRRVKGLRRIGVLLGNWLTPAQGRRLLESATPSTERQLRDHARVAMLIGCGLRRAELLALRLESIQKRKEHRVIADLLGKAGHVRTGLAEKVSAQGTTMSTVLINRTWLIAALVALFTLNLRSAPRAQSPPTPARPIIELEKTRFDPNEDVFFWVGVTAADDYRIPQSLWSTCRLTITRPDGTRRIDVVGWPEIVSPGLSPAKCRQLCSRPETLTGWNCRWTLC